MNNAKWHVLYTRSRFEKKVYESLCLLGIEAFLPLYKTLRQWKDRKKWVEEPLFRSYCFAKINSANYLKALNVKGVVRYVWFDEKPAIIPEEEIEFIKIACNSSYKIEPVESNNFYIGQRVKVIKGIFKNYEGEILEFKGKHRLLFRITNMPFSLTIQIPKNYLKSYES